MARYWEPRKINFDADIKEHKVDVRCILTIIEEHEGIVKTVFKKFMRYSEVAKVGRLLVYERPSPAYHNTSPARPGTVRERQVHSSELLPVSEESEAEVQQSRTPEKKKSGGIMERLVSLSEKFGILENPKLQQSDMNVAGQRKWVLFWHSLVRCNSRYIGDRREGNKGRTFRTI